MLLPGRVASASGPSDLLPDLVADPPSGASLQDYASPDGSRDLLLRFDGYVHNAGAGALDIEASRASSSDPMPPLQRIFRTDGSHHDDAMPGAQLVYTDADGHDHWHLQNVARYTLWNQAKTQQVAPSMKVGFCLMDSQQMTGSTPAFYLDSNGRDFCQKHQPDALSLFEGVSSGWRDIYDSSLAFQWVVASDVQPGVYWLREDVDPGNVIRESDDNSGPAYSTSSTTIPGYVARAIAAPTTGFGQSQRVTLGADSFGSPGARRFKIVTSPAHGTLDVAPGTSFTGPDVTYTPDPGYSGSDSFTYSASDSTTAYPRHPGVATVALSVGTPAPSVLIDSAPDSVETGYGVQLHATVAHDAPGVTWSVDGVEGGDDAVGTITTDGFYTAPASVPAGGTVTIEARSASGARDQRTVEITPTPAPVAAPTPPVVEEIGQQPAGGKTPRRTKPSKLGPIGVGRAGRALVVAIR